MSITYKEWQKQLRKRSGSPEYPDSAIRWKPDAINVPEALGYAAVSDVPGLSELTFLQRSLQNALNIQNQTTLKSISLPFLETVSADLVLAENAALTSLSAPVLRLPTHGTSVTGASLDFSGNALPASDIDAIINRLALSLYSGVEYNLTIDFSGGTNAVPTAASSLARSSLYLGAASYAVTLAVAS